MARLDDIAEPMRTHLRDLPCANFDTTPWAEGPPLKERRVALISTAGLQRRDDRPFAVGANDYRVIPADIPAGELIISHISTNFDRTGFQQDWNVMFPLDRLHELADAGEIGSVAAYHYSFMGATDPEAMEPVARQLAGMLRQDGVDAVALVPV
jgi:D-proline reductase (dithiol) PrdB